jgi:MFS family permease
VFASRRLDLSQQEIGFATTLLAVAELLVLPLAGRAADRAGRAVVLVPSLALIAAATAALGSIEGMPWAYGPLMAAMGAGIAASSVAAGGLLADSIPPGGSGAAVGVNQMAGDLGYLISPTAIGSLAERTSFSTAYWIAAVPAALVAVAGLRTSRGTARSTAAAR